VYLIIWKQKESHWWNHCCWCWLVIAGLSGTATIAVIISTILVFMFLVIGIVTVTKSVQFVCIDAISSAFALLARGLWSPGEEFVVAPSLAPAVLRCHLVICPTPWCLWSHTKLHEVKLLYDVKLAQSISRHVSHCKMSSGRIFPLAPFCRHCFWRNVLFLSQLTTSV